MGVKWCVGGVLGALGASWGRLRGVLGAFRGRLGALWGVLGRLGSVFGASWGILGRLRGVCATSRGRVVAFYKIYYTTAVNTHIIRQVSSYNRLKFVRNHLKIIKIVSKHHDVS